MKHIHKSKAPSKNTRNFLWVPYMCDNAQGVGKSLKKGLTFGGGQ